MNTRYRLLEHPADLRLRLYGGTIRALFQNSVIALSSLLVDLRSVREKESRKIRLTAGDLPHLLVLLLKEVLFLFEAKQFLSGRLVVEKLDGKMLTGRLEGERITADHQLKSEIKAVTYHGLKVEKKRGRWVAEVILDV